MTYNKQPWADGPDGGTPITAARLNHMEDGIGEAVTPDQLDTAVVALQQQDGVMAGDLAAIQTQLGPVGTGLSQAQADLATATALPTAGALVRRASTGSFDVPSPTTVSNPTSKFYVDNKISNDIAQAIAGVVTTVTYENVPAGSTITILKATTWPARPTARADVIVAWKGPDPSPAIVTTGTGGMRDGVDYRLVTP